VLILLNMIQLILYSLVLTIDVKNVEIKKTSVNGKTLNLLRVHSIVLNILRF